MRASDKTTDNSHQTLFSMTCESGKFTPYVHPDEVTAVKHPCDHRLRKNIVTCKDESRELFLDEVNGLDMSTVSLHNAPQSIPEFIPIVPHGMFQKSAAEIPSEVVGVMLNDILTKGVRSRAGFYLLPEDAEINRNILLNPIFRGKEVILFSVGQDVLIETLWWDRQGKKFFKAIAEMGFAAVTGMNFSVISGECPFGHALNIKKSLCYCHELDTIGVQTIPHIYAINDHQRERWRNWLLANPAVRIITINSQLQRKQGRGMDDVFKTARFLLSSTNVEIILHGRGKGLPIDLRKSYGQRLHFAASGPIKNAMIRKDKTTAEYIELFIQEVHPQIVQ